MKKFSALALALALVFLASCGNASDADSTTESAKETETVTVFKPDDGKFKYFSKDFPSGWTIQPLTQTSSYVEAKYGDGENAPELIVSVFDENNELGDSRAKNLATAVKENQKGQDIVEAEIGGLKFYMVQYPSLSTEGRLCYDFFGQTKPDKDNNYHFINVKFDNIQSAGQYNSLKAALGSLEFKF